MTRLFTPLEANRTLPLVQRIVASDLERDLHALLKELHAIGCDYKDAGFEQGLVDFPAKIEDEDVYLCWRSDEDSITWYHPVREGFAGRRKIPAALLAGEG